MTPEIAELIKKKAEDKYRGLPQLREPYILSQIEAIEMMVGFMLWADDNYWRLGNKDEWVYDVTDREGDLLVLTTIELLTKYIKEVLSK